MNIRSGSVPSLITAVLMMLVLSPATAQDASFFRIGTGGPNGTYYPIGSLIAQSINDVPGESICEGDSCDVPGIIAIAQTANGSIANIEEIQAGTLEAGLAQSNIAHWAYTGTGVYSGKPKVTNIQAVAKLYTESMHLVARKDKNINSVEDLRGKRVSIDEPGSGTLVDARLVLKYYGISTDDIDVRYTKPSVAKSMMMSGDLDAFFIVAGFPISAVTELARTGDIDLIPISGAVRDKLVSEEKYYSINAIPAHTYQGIAATETIGVGALLLVSSAIDADTVYRVTKAIWSDHAASILTSGHHQGKEIVLERAADGVTVPFHSGASRFYREIGLAINP